MISRENFEIKSKDTIDDIQNKQKELLEKSSEIVDRFGVKFLKDREKVYIDFIKEKQLEQEIKKYMEKSLKNCERELDREKDSNLIEKIKMVKKVIPNKIKKKYNFAYARVEIDGFEKKDFFAHSRIKKIEHVKSNFNNVNDGIINISEIPKKKIFKTLSINEKQEIDTIDSWDRVEDSECKILTDIALRIGENRNVQGNILLYTDLECCKSCKNVIKQFKDKYTNINIEIVYEKNILV